MICGNGKKGIKDCEDGNRKIGDGCSSNCRVEDGWVCEGGDINKVDNCTCEPRDEYGVISETWEKIYIIYDRRLILMDTQVN